MYIYIEYITNSIRSISFFNQEIYGIFDDMKQPVGGMEEYLSTEYIRAIAMVKLHFMKLFVGDEGNQSIYGMEWMKKKDPN